MVVAELSGGESKDLGSEDAKSAPLKGEKTGGDELRLRAALGGVRGGLPAEWACAGLSIVMDSTE